MRNESSRYLAAHCGLMCTISMIMDLDHSCVLDGVCLFSLLGSGSYAKVYKGEWKGIQVAVKQLHEIFSDAESQERAALTRTFYKELGMNMRLRHPNIIQFLGVVLPQHSLQGRNSPPLLAGEQNGFGNCNGGRNARADDFPMMVMELMHCTLEKRLGEYRERGTRMPFCETVDIATDIVAALVYLHEKEPRPIAHRDLAPKNVLLSSSGTAKLCDLGVAKWANSSLNNTPGPGTLPYMPPEVRIGTQYSPVAVDIYSFGVTLLEMCSGIEPKPKDFAQMTSAADGSYKLVPERIRREKSFSALPKSHSLIVVIEKCLQAHADKRPKAHQLLKTLQEMKRSAEYLETKQMSESKTCSLCEEKDDELLLFKQQIEKQEREISRLSEENKALQKFRDEQLCLLQFKLQTAAKEGEKYRQQIQEIQDELEEQVKANHQLEVSNDRTKDINYLLRQKVAMDSQLHQCSHPLQCGKEKSMSVREHGTKPIPKPRKSLPTAAKSTECLDDTTEEASGLTIPSSLYLSSAVSGSVPFLPGAEDPTDDGSPTYLQLDAVAMQKAQRKNYPRAAIRKPHPLVKRSSSPGFLGQDQQASAKSTENMYTPTPRAKPVETPTHQDVPTVATDNQALKKTLKPLHLSPPVIVSDDDPIYVKIPATGPPTPPPRDQEFTFTRGKPQSVSLHSPFSGPKRLSIIEENDESLKSPNMAGTPGLTRAPRTSQSMKSPRRGDPQTLALPRPHFGRQSSRGDVLISQVLCNVKGKNSSELTARKGELVKVTNNALEKKLCIAVKTNGESGTIRKKNIDRIEPVSILYDSSNPALSTRKGVINHIAQCISHNNAWVSPVESHRILIIPSSIHSGDVGLLVKMTDYLLCCTDSEQESHFEIDLREQRLLKLTGYVMQCHSDGNNGAPLQWKLEGSHNGRSWNSLSEESGTFFRTRHANYFPVTNPIPCRYFRLTQLGKNTAGNFRFCLSGIELYGQLYSSVIEERFTREY